MRVFLSFYTVFLNHFVLFFYRFVLFIVLKMIELQGYTPEQGLPLGGRHNEEYGPSCLMNLHELEKCVFKSCFSTVSYCFYAKTDEFGRHTETVVPGLYDGKAWSEECNPGAPPAPAAPGALLTDDRSDKSPVHSRGHSNTGRGGMVLASAAGSLQHPSGKHDGWVRVILSFHAVFVLKHD